MSSELRRNLRINGITYHLAVNQYGSGAPTQATPGKPAVLYMDTDTGALYKCTAADAEAGIYAWELLEGSGGSSYVLPVAGTELGGVRNGGNVVINEDGTMTAPTSGQNAGFVVSDTAPEDTAVLWVDTTDEAEDEAPVAEVVSAALKEAKESGEFDGADGYSPVRGTDYWTEDDKAEIKAYVDEAILGGAW